MLHEIIPTVAGARRAANEDQLPSRPRTSPATTCAATDLPGCGPGVITFDERHDAHWTAVPDPDFEHLVALFVHAGQLEDPELRAMIEEVVAPRLRTMLLEGARAGHCSPRSAP